MARTEPEPSSSRTVPRIDRRRFLTDDVCEGDRVAVSHSAGTFSDTDDRRKVSRQRIGPDPPVTYGVVARRDRLGRDGAIDAEAPGSNPPQRLEVGAAAEHFAKIMRERPHVKAGGATIRKLRQPACKREFDRVQLTSCSVETVTSTGRSSRACLVPCVLVGAAAGELLC